MRWATWGAGAAMVLGVRTAGAQTVSYQKADLIRASGAFVLGATLEPSWFADSIRFFYVSSGAADRGTVYVVDPRRRSRRVLFDQARIAAALSVAADTALDPTRLPRPRLVDHDRAVQFDLRARVFWCDVATQHCARADSARVATEHLRSGPTWAVRSPDHQWDAFAYRGNLSLRPAAATDAEAGRARPDSSARRDSMPLPSSASALTTDGTPLWSYGTELHRVADLNAGPRPVRPQVTWSPDSRKLVVLRYDVRHVRRYPLYSSTGDRPTDASYLYAVPGDTAIPRYDAYVIDVAARTSVKVRDTPVPALVEGISGLDGVKWGRGSDEVYLLNATRGSKRVTASVVSTATGIPRTIARDSMPTNVELYLGGNGTPNWAVVNGGEDVLWFSERDGWAHLYRYAKDGTLKNQIDRGPYAVQAIAYVDSVKRQVYFTAWGRGPGLPYYAHLYRANFDGTGVTLLTPEDGNHRIAFVPAGGYFIDRFSRVDVPPVTTLRDASGRVLLELARADVGLLRQIGWTPAQVFTVKARDNVTDLYGLLYTPSDFDSTKTYPIITHIYPGPQTGSVSDWAFTTGSYGSARALAELGFVVIQLDALGTPKRSKAFHDFTYGHLGDNGLPDQVAAIRQLAARHRWIDITRVGIFGHSGGGFAAADAMFRYPDFFKVAVSESGNHDNRSYGAYWGEKYQGVLTRDSKTGKDSYEAEANSTLAANLTGKLLLIHGEMDSNVNPSSTLRVVDALIRANKDFDMLIIPGAPHRLPDYSVRVGWDYFVRHLLGAEPPVGYRMTPSNAR